MFFTSRNYGTHYPRAIRGVGTSELNGLYALQLQVVRSDQRVDTAIIQVTISN